MYECSKQPILLIKKKLTKAKYKNIKKVQAIKIIMFNLKYNDIFFKVCTKIKD